MNTLTIAVLVLCATMVYASAVPGDSGESIQQAAEPAEELLEGAESANRGYGHGGYGHGGHGHHGHGGGHYGK